MRNEFRLRIQETLNKLYEFRVIQPRKVMNCYQYIKDNFHLLNGKLYRPCGSSNYLILALIRKENKELWANLKVRSEVIDRETRTNDLLIEDIQKYFHVSASFLLDKDLSIPNIKNVGSLEPLPKKDSKNVLTGLVRKKDEYFENFTCHRAISYTMERIPAINLKDIQFFLPMVGGAIDGYYKVDKVYIGSLKGNACLKLNLSTYISLGDKQVKIYGSKMQPGELISENMMKNLYEI